MLASSVQLAACGRRNPIALFLPANTTLKSRYTARAGTTGLGTLFASSSAGTPPAVTITATNFDITAPCDIQITKTGTRATAEFRISGDGGNSWTSGQTMNDGGGGAYVFNGENLTFAAGTYNVDYRYTRVIAQERSQIGSVACTVSSVSNPLYQPKSANGYSTVFMNGVDTCLTGIGNADSIAPSGTDIAYTVVAVGNIVTLGTAAGAQPLWGFGRNVTSANPFHHFSLRGPAGTPANNWASTREDNVPANVAVNSGSPVPDLEPAIFVFRYSGTNLTVDIYTTVNGQVTAFANVSQNVGAMTVDQLTIGGLNRFATAFAGCNVRFTEFDVYASDVGSDGANRLINMYRTKFAIDSRHQVKRLICLLDGGQSNSNGIIGTFMPAPPPGLPFSQMRFFRRVLLGTEAISDTTLQQLKFTTVAGGTYHGSTLQTAIDLWFDGFNVFVLNCSANGTYLTDWIGAGTHSAALDDAIGDAITLLNSYYPNATLEWYWKWDQGEAEAKDASSTPATDWPTNFGSYGGGGPAAGTLLKKINDATGQVTRPRIILAQSQLNVLPSIAPQLATIRASQTTAATDSTGFLLDIDSIVTQSQYLMADNTHRTGRCQNTVGSLWSASLLANELSGGP